MLRVREIKLEYDIDSAANLRLKILKKLRLPKDCNLTYKIVKKSIDARKKPEVYYVYEVLCNLDKNLEENLLKVNNKKIIKKIVMKLIHNYFLFFILTVKSVT